MGNPNYLDFELRIEKRGQRYQATVMHSPCGEASISFKLPFSKLELENFVLRVGSTRRGVRRISSPEMQVVRQFGTRLFESVFTESVRSCLISSQNEAKNRRAGLRIKLRLEAPELINVPWEYLYDASLGRFLALFENTPIVRYVDIPERTLPLKIKPPLSILVMISSPEDYAPLEVAHERTNLLEALKELVNEGMINITWMDQPTLPALTEYLLRGQYNIFHFIGHGGFDEQNQDGVLVLEDDFKRGYYASSERLAVLLGNQEDLRLVVLNACEGGRTSASDPFAGIATTLVRTGSVPAVVAMQLAITDQAAITFARGFYNALSVGRPVDGAVTQARLAIFADGNDVEWATPVLYMRSPDGQIFDLEALSPVERENRKLAAQMARREAEEHEEAEKQAVERRKERLAVLYEQVVTQLAQNEWGAAHELLVQIQKIEPGYRDTPDLLKRAKDEQERLNQKTILFNLGKENFAKGDWAQAMLVFKQILGIFPDDAKTQELLEDAKTRSVQQIEDQQRAERDEKLASMYDQVTSYMESKDWADALTSLAQFKEIDPSYRDVPALIERTQSEISREEKLSVLLAEAKTDLEQKEWSRATNALNSATELVPDCVEAQLLLTEARAGLEQQVLVENRLIEKSAPASAVKTSRPTSHPEEIRSQSKTLGLTSMPEKLRSQQKPKDLPK
jgi:tetratricopeptide (TPR) repeat protein